MDKIVFFKMESGESMGSRNIETSGQMEMAIVNSDVNSDDLDTNTEM